MIQEYYEHDEIEYSIKVGENAQDNWDIIASSKQNDLWFHISKFPSCHVVLEVSGKKSPHRSAINRCAIICKERSKTPNKVDVIYTEIKNVKKADKVGSVYTKKTRIIKL